MLEGMANMNMSNFGNAGTAGNMNAGGGQQMASTSAASFWQSRKDY
jgi:hypothetical protein